MLTVKYFAYGSNIDIARLKNRVEKWGLPQLLPGVPYVLKNYHLTFNAGAAYGYCSYANIVPMQGSFVEGILYDMTPEQFDLLDRCEGLYHKEFFQLDSNTIACAYVANKDSISTKRVKPTLEYLNIIIDACLATGLTRTYDSLVIYKRSNYRLKNSRHQPTKLYRAWP